MPLSNPIMKTSWLINEFFFKLQQNIYIKVLTKKIIRRRISPFTSVKRVMKSCSVKKKKVLDNKINNNCVTIGTFNSLYKNIPETGNIEKESFVFSYVKVSISFFFNLSSQFQNSMLSSQLVLSTNILS